MEIMRGVTRRARVCVCVHAHLCEKWSGLYSKQIVKIQTPSAESQYLKAQRLSLYFNLPCAKYMTRGISTYTFVPCMNNVNDHFIACNRGEGSRTKR